MMPSVTPATWRTLQRAASRRASTTLVSTSGAAKRRPVTIDCGPAGSPKFRRWFPATTLEAFQE